MQTKLKKSLSILLALVMLVGLLPTMAFATGGETYPNYATVNNTDLYNTSYFKNGDTASCSGSADDYNAKYDSSTGVLELKNYDGGNISTTGSSGQTTTIKITGTNTITTSNRDGISAMNGGSVVITSDGAATLNINITGSVNDDSAVSGIRAHNPSNATGSVTVSGNVTLNIVAEVKSTNSTTAFVTGIYAANEIKILGSAAVTVKCVNKANNITSNAGLKTENGTNRKITFNTTGNISVDVFDSNGYSYALRSDGYAMTKADLVTLKWSTGNAGGTTGGPLYSGENAFADTSWAINKNDTAKVATYKYGTPYTVEVFGAQPDRNSGKYVVGETVTLTAHAPYDSAFGFKKWASSDITEINNATNKTVTFEMPAKKVNVVAYYNIFETEPLFTRKDNSSGNITYKLKQAPNSVDWYSIDGAKIEFPFSTAQNCTQEVGTFKTPAGTYYLQFNINSGVYRSEPIVVDYSVGGGLQTHPEKPTITVSGTYTYSGSEQTASVSGYDSTTMNISGNKATNAGDYTVDVTSKTGQWADGTTDAVTASWTILKANQATPTGLTGVAPTTDGGNDGKITGLNASKKYEYKLNTADTYTDVTDNAAEITGLSAGEYKVRLKEDSNHNPGIDADVTVPAYSVHTYSVTVHGGTASPSGAQAKDTVITITADNAAAGMQFKEWTGAGALNFVDGTNKTSATAKFKMPENNVSVTATYTGAPLTGTAKISGFEQFDQKLTATLNSSNNTGELTYKWYRSGVVNPIAEGTNEYTLVADDIGKTITVKITSSVQSGEKTATTGTIAKADGPAKPASFTIATKTSSTITVTPKTGWEYSKDNGATWQDSNEFTGLTASTTYEITVRVKETETTKASETADKQDVKTKSAGGSTGGSYVAPIYSIDTAKAENGSINVSPKSASKGDAVTISVTPDKGYELDELTVLDKNGTEIKLTAKDGKYTFTMPTSKVTVKATFEKIKANPNTGAFLFDDVKPGDYFYDAVLWAVDKGITVGTSDTTFSPNEPCTRGQIVTFLWRAAGSPEPKSAASFSDVAADAYYAKAVAWAVEQGITKGTSETTFSPDAICNRAQAVTFLSRALKGTATAGNTFSDVAANSYYAEAVAWAVANDITKGTSATTFSPDDDCTRGQIVTFLFRAMAE